MIHSRAHALSLFGILSLSIVFVSQLSFAQGGPTPAQIAHLKSLSFEEQQELAESFGIEVPQQLQNDQPQIREPVASPQIVVEAEPQAKSLGEEEKPAEKLKRFGADIFNAGPEAFLPASDIPVPADYILGPGDVIVIQLYGKENRTHSLTVNREGQIQFPEIGPVNLAGLSFQQARQVIADIVKEQMIGIKSSITMGVLRSIRVFVLGDVVQPGSFTVGSLSTMTNALFASGGITEVGSMRNIQLKRKGEIVTTLDLYDLLLIGDTSADARLLPGDVIFVPPISKTISIAGQVKRPAVYEFDSKANIKELIKIAGGVTDSAYLPLVRVDRVTKQREKTLINLDLTKAGNSNFLLESGDRVTLASILDIIDEQVVLSGHLKRPGEYQWKSGMRFTDVVKNVEGLMDNPDTTIAIIVRITEALRKTQIISFSPQRAWESPSSNANPILAPRDEIILFDFNADRAELLTEIVEQLNRQSEYLEQAKTVTILGSVRFEGTYPLVENMDIKDLIALSGGLLESAFGFDAEVTRYELSEEMERVVSHIPVNLSEEPLHLRAGDTLQIKRIPKWKEKETVSIRGEVKFPGTYTLLPGETLLDVIQRSGGLTEYAYAKGAIFSRAALRDLEENRLSELKDKLESDIASAGIAETEGAENIEEDEAKALLENLERTKPLGRMVIDLPAILSGNNDDFQLENGDALTIPRFKPSVTVLGEVQYPTSHFYDKKLSTKDYINRSGGTKIHADKKRIYIVKANGRVLEPSRSAWFQSNSGQIEPGDTIIVPLNADQVDPLTIWAKVTTIMYQAALGAAAVGSL